MLFPLDRILSMESPPLLVREFAENCTLLMMVFLDFITASLVAQIVKNPPAMQETPVQFLGQEDPLEKG